MKLEDLNEKRSSAFLKRKEDEDFLKDFNQYLFQKELTQYRDYPIEHPFFFVIGLPRSGTTLMSQFLAHSFEMSYINNLAARFYLAPLHGIRFSRQVLPEKRTTFSSNYALTDNLSDIHEFGYFWRYWLRKSSLEDVASCKEEEDNIDWKNLQKCLSTIQHEWNTPSVFKNIFGSYHLPRLKEILGKIMIIYIERDELDVASSIFQARIKYYGKGGSNQWWSYAPPEVLHLLDRDVYEQIAGQIYYLKSFYNSELQKLPPENMVKVNYEQLCREPLKTAEKIRESCYNSYNYSLSLSENIPDFFESRNHQADSEFKAKIAKAMDTFTKRT